MLTPQEAEGYTRWRWQLQHRKPLTEDPSVQAQRTGGIQNYRYDSPEPFPASQHDNDNDDDVVGELGLTIAARAVDVGHAPGGYACDHLFVLPGFELEPNAFLSQNEAILLLIKDAKFIDGTCSVSCSSKCHPPEDFLALAGSSVENISAGQFLGSNEEQHCDHAKGAVVYHEGKNPHLLCPLNLTLIVAVFLEFWKPAGEGKQRLLRAPTTSEEPLQCYLNGFLTLVRVNEEDPADATIVRVLHNSLRCLQCSTKPKSCRHIKELKGDVDFHDAGLHFREQLSALEAFERDLRSFVDPTTERRAPRSLTTSAQPQALQQIMPSTTEAQQLRRLYEDEEAIRPRVCIQCGEDLGSAATIAVQNSFVLLENIVKNVAFESRFVSNIYFCDRPQAERENERLTFGACIHLRQCKACDRITLADGTEQSLFRINENLAVDQATLLRALEPRSLFHTPLTAFFRHALGCCFNLQRTQVEEKYGKYKGDFVMGVIEFINLQSNDYDSAFQCTCTHRRETVLVADGITLGWAKRSAAFAVPYDPHLRPELAEEEDGRRFVRELLKASERCAIRDQRTRQLLLRLSDQMRKCLTPSELTMLDNSLTGDLGLAQWALCQKNAAFWAHNNFHF